jgi:hypothetical protein
MSEYSELIERLRRYSDDRGTYNDDFKETADALEAQAERIAELEVPLCIGQRTIGIMAEEGCWQSENGRAVVAADELFRQDPYARIAELEEALREALDYIDNPDSDLAIRIVKTLEKRK